MDTSLYLLFKAIRRHSTVALSGESADEAFGGYRWFFNPLTSQADTFPWMFPGSSFGSGQGRDTAILQPGLAASMKLPEYIRDSYADAVRGAQRLDGESDLEWRMRKVSYLHLTRFLRQQLDRKDRMSMAVGLEVRVPFCDHRLVEYVYNTPWELKTFDGREKSLLRAATADLLPRSVTERVKAPYPAILDPAYAVQLQRHAREYLATPGHPVFELVTWEWVANAVTLDVTQIARTTRSGLERVLELAQWLDLYRPTLKFS